MPTWRLRPPTITDTYKLHNGQTFKLTREVTVFGTDEGLHIAIEGAPVTGGSDQGSIPYNEIDYLWWGGHYNTTDDPNVRDLWAAHNLDYEEIE